MRRVRPFATGLPLPFPMVPMRRPLVSLLLALGLLGTVHAPRAHAATARDLSGRIRIDGSYSDWAADEAIFQFNDDAGALEEPIDDSKWGINEDINNIGITWDSKYLYLLGTGVIWDNNMVLLLDTVPGRGLASMTNLNSWKRNFAFDTTGSGRGGGFSPDLFGATWDGNNQPRLIVQLNGNSVDDEVVGPNFNAAATFKQGNLGRAMEFAIPWRSVFLGQAGLGTKDTLMTVGGVTDTLHFFPRGTKIKVAGVVTAGADGTSGPDTAPDNLSGTSNDAGAQVFIDNWAVIDLDRNDDTGLGNGGPDGIADWNVSPRDRVTFRLRPPFPSKQFAPSRLDLDRPAFRPDLGEKIHWSFRLSPPPNPDDAFDQTRTVNLTVKIYDVRGNVVRTFTDAARSAVTTNSPADAWDGRDEQGRIVTPGLYVVRLSILGSPQRPARTFVVVR